MKKFILICGLMINIATAMFGQGVSNWGFNIHDGGIDPQNVADKLVERNFNCVRMDLWGSDPVYLAKFRNVVAILKAKNISTEAVVYTVFSNGQSRSQDCEADLAEVEQTAYDLTKPQIEATKDLMQDYELQNEISLFPNIKVAGSTGQKASDYEVPCARMQAAVLRGMSRAIDDVRYSSNLPLRIILGTTDRSFGFLTFMQQEGVLFDVVGYHIYPWENHSPLDKDPWFGTGGPLGQLAKFNKPIHINEFQSGEIYSGAPGQPVGDYENQAGKPITEAGYRSLDKHLKEIVHQKVANVETIIYYELWDEANKDIPENRFGMYYDNNLQEPKISLLLASCFAGGFLSPVEIDSLAKRKLGICYPTGSAELDNSNSKSVNQDSNLKCSVSTNPGNDHVKLFVETNDFKDLRYELFNMMGKSLQKGTVDNEQTEISIKNLSSSIYLIKISRGSIEMNALKIMKN